MRRSLAASAAIGLTASFAACSSPESSATAPDCAPAGEKVTLQYWNQVPGMDDVIKVWNEKNPDIQVESKNISNDAVGQISNALSANQAPELAQVGYDQLAFFRIQDGFVDVSACEDAVAAEDDFVPWTWSQTSFGNEGIYAFPQDTGPLALFYRTDLFEAHGIEVPTTWDEFTAAGEKLKAADPNLDITFFDPKNAEMFYGYLSQAHANMYDYTDDEWNVTIQNDNSKKVADFWQNLIDKDLVRTDLASFSTPLYSAYGSDQLATFVTAAWGYSLLRDNLPDQSGKWAVAPLPTWGADDKSSGGWGGSTVAFLKGNDHLYESVKFNLWLNTDPEALAMLNTLGGLYPAANAGLSLPQLNEGVDFYGGQHIFDVFRESSENIDPDFPWGPTQKTVSLALQDNLSDAVNGKSSIWDALGATQDAAIKSMVDQDIPVAEK